METALSSSRFWSRKRFVFVFGLLIGLAFGLIERDWYIGSMGAFSFWIVLGLTAQARDIRDCYRHNTGLTSDERWGWRFAWSWRWAICAVIGFSFLARLLVRFKLLLPIAVNIEGDWHVSSESLWDYILLCSIIVAVAGSCGLARPGGRRPWLWGLFVLRGLIAGVLFLIILELRQIFICLVHITIVSMMLAQPLRYSMEVVAASSTNRIDEFCNIATAGVLCLILSCILLWQVSVWWRSSWWRKACLGALLTITLVALVFLTARVILVEIPTISPIMAAKYAEYTLTALQWAAVVVLTAGLAAAIARCWADSQSAGNVPRPASWRRDENKYYHEQQILLWPLVGVAVAKTIALGHDIYLQPYLFRNWEDIVFELFAHPATILFLALVLLVMRIAVTRREKRVDAIVTTQPRLVPGLFVLLWFALLVIIVCSVPLLSSWQVASYLWAGQFPGL